MQSIAVQVRCCAADESQLITFIHSFNQQYFIANSGIKYQINMDILPGPAQLYVKGVNACVLSMIAQITSAYIHAPAMQNDSTFVIQGELQVYDVQLYDYVLYICIL